MHDTSPHHDMWLYFNDTLFLDKPSIVWVCRSAQWYVCHGVWHYTWLAHDISLDSHSSLSFNSEDGGVYCSQHFTLGLCIISRYIGCTDTLAIRYISYHSFQLHDTSNDTVVLKFRIFWSLKFPNSYEICGYIRVFWSKTRKKCIFDTYRILLYVYRDMYHIA